MNILGIFGKKSTEGKRKSVLELSTEEKSALEDDKNSGVPANLSSRRLFEKIPALWSRGQRSTPRKKLWFCTALDPMNIPVLGQHRN